MSRAKAVLSSDPFRGWFNVPESARDYSAGRIGVQGRHAFFAQFQAYCLSSVPVALSSADADAVRRETREISRN